MSMVQIIFDHHSSFWLQKKKSTFSWRYFWKKQLLTTKEINFLNKIFREKDFLNAGEFNFLHEIFLEETSFNKQRRIEHFPGYIPEKKNNFRWQKKSTFSRTYFWKKQLLNFGHISLGKVWTPLPPSSYRLNSTTTVFFYKDDFGINSTMPLNKKIKNKERNQRTWVTKSIYNNDNHHIK